MALQLSLNDTAQRLRQFYALTKPRVTALAVFCAVIGMFLRDTPKERPLTHDLIQSIFKGFSISVERVVITELKNSTYFARLILQQQNEVARKIVEIDARPSDCLALATAQKRPIFVSHALFEQVEDMSEVLDRINENGNEAE